MYRRLVPAACVLLASLAFTGVIDPLPIGSAAPLTDYAMTSTEGEALTLADAERELVLSRVEGPGRSQAWGVVVDGLVADDG